jgi:hypothetical protein
MIGMYRDWLFRSGFNRACMQYFIITTLAINVNKSVLLSQSFLSRVTVLFRYCAHVVCYL